MLQQYKYLPTCSLMYTSSSEISCSCSSCSVMYMFEQSLMLQASLHLFHLQCIHNQVPYMNICICMKADQAHLRSWRLYHAHDGKYSIFTHNPTMVSLRRGNLRACMWISIPHASLIFGSGRVWVETIFALGVLARFNITFLGTEELVL